MKKGILFTVVLGVCVCSCIQAYAYLEPTGPRTETVEGSAWLAEHQTDVRLSEFLQGHYAFADGCTRAWIVDRYVDMERPAIMDEQNKNFSIPSSVAKRYFNLTVTGDYVSSADIANYTNYNVFFDPRGFCMLYQGDTAVDTNTYGTDSYQDNYLTLAAIGDLNWQPVTLTDDDFAKLRQNWYAALTVPDDHPNAASVKQTLINTAKPYFDSVSLGENKQGPFSDLQFGDVDISSATAMSTLGSVADRIYAMATAYVVDGKQNETYKQAILDTLEYTYVNQLSLGRELFDKSTSWPNYQFDVSFRIGNAMCLMYEYLSEETVQKYTDALFDLSPEPTVKTGNTVGNKGNRNYMTGTNRMWSSVAFMNVAILANDNYRVQYPLRFINEAFISVYKYKCNYLQMPSDGWYDDGSMVFHNDVAYNTSYGADFLRTCSSLLAITKGTVLDVREKLYCWDRIYDIISNNVVPFFVDGRPMKITNGRHDPTQTTSSIFGPCIYISYYADQAVKEKIWSLLAADVISNDDLDSYGESAGGGKATRGYIGWTASADFVDFANNYAQTHVENSNWNGVYNVMNKAVHQADGWKAAVAMSSTRIKKYENYATNDATSSAYQWYINDGAVYIYTGDHLQFEQRYFVDMNPYYVPGTTVDAMPRVYESTEGNIRAQATNEWAGGVSNGKESVVGMVMGNGNLSGLEGKKSYFLLDDKIICIGTGITGGTGKVHTTVDNRIITKTQGIDRNAEMTIVPVSGDFSGEGVTLDFEVLFDGNLTNGFATDQVGEYLTFDFGETVDLGGAAFAWYNGTKRIEKFAIAMSDDGVNFRQVYVGQSSGDTQKYQYFAFDARGRYLRLYLNGSNLNNSTWQFYSDMKFIKKGFSSQQVTSLLSLPMAGYEAIIVDDEQIEVNFDMPQSYAADYVQVEDVSGYVFLDETPVEIEREVSGKSGNVFVQISVDHGESPKGSSYAYAMLPKYTLEETKAYAQDPDIEILMMTDGVHAIRNVETGMVFINFFKPGECAGIEALTPCSMLVDHAGGQIFVADPTVGQKTIKFKLPEDLKLKTGGAVLFKDGIYEMDISADRSLIYNAQLAGTLEENEFVSTVNYQIETASRTVSTKLFAYQQGEQAVQYSLLEAPVYGDAIIDGDKLHYTFSGAVPGVQDTVRVKAVFEDGAVGLIDVKVVGY